MAAQLDQTGMEVDLVAATFEHDTFEVVVQDDSWLSAPNREAVDVPAQEVLHGLIEEELQIERPRVGQRHHETGESAFGAAHQHVAEVRPVDLGLLAGQGVQLQKRLAFLRTQARHGAAQLHDAAAVAAVPQHGMDARGAQTGMLFEGLADERQIGLGEGCAHGRRAAETLAFDGMADGIGMNLEFGGDGADSPMLGKEVTSDQGAGFRADHAEDLTFVVEYAGRG